MNLILYSKMTKLVWEAWKAHEISTDQKDQMLSEIHKLARIEEKIWLLGVLNILLTFISFSLIAMIMLAYI